MMIHPTDNRAVTVGCDPNSTPIKKTHRCTVNLWSTSPLRGWTAVLGCSYRALSIFRICLGSLLLLELVLRFRFLRPFYSNEGTLPLHLLMDKVDNLYKCVCLHCHFEQLWQQQVLLSVQVIAATCFTIGFQTRFMSIVSWYLYISLTLRNTWMSYILDRYFHYLLFLSMFLPLDAYRGITSAFHKTKQHGWYISPATVAFKCLVIWIYLDAGYGKYTDPVGGWSYYHPSSPLPALDTYARHTTAAQYLYAVLGPSGLRLLTPVVVWLELLATPVALLGTYLGNDWMVGTAIASICSLHVGIAITLRNATLLSFVACTAWCVFLPLDRYNSTLTRSRVSGTVLSMLLIGAMIVGNLWLTTISQVCDQSVKHIWSTLLHNRWNVFVSAETYVTWEIAPGMLRDGSIVDVWGRRDTVNWNLPGDGAPCTATARPGRWRSFPSLAGLEGAEGDALWSYLCKEWDRENNVDVKPGRKLLKFNMFMLQSDVLPNMQFSPTRKRLIMSYDCVIPANATHTDSNDQIHSKGETLHIAIASEIIESRHLERMDTVQESNEPEVPKESGVPTEEPKFVDPDRSEPVPGDIVESTVAVEDGYKEIVSSESHSEMSSDVYSAEPEVPKESGIPTEEPKFVDPNRSEPVPGDKSDDNNVAADSKIARKFTNGIQAEKRIDVANHEPEIAMETGVPTEEPKFVDPDRSEPVPGDIVEGTVAVEDGYKEIFSSESQCKMSSDVYSAEPEVPKESGIPTEEPKLIDTNRSEPVPGDKSDDNNVVADSKIARKLTNGIQDEQRIDVMNHESEIPKESGVPTEEPKFVDLDRSEPVPGDDVNSRDEVTSTQLPSSQQSETGTDMTQPEVSKESDIPTEEPKFVDPNRSEPVPGDKSDDRVVADSDLSM